MCRASIRAIDVVRKRGLLTVADGLLGAESGGSETTEVRHDDPEALCGEDGGDIGVAVDVVGPAVEQDDGLAVGRACFGVADVRSPASICLIGPSWCVGAGGGPALAGVDVHAVRVMAPAAAVARRPKSLLLKPFIVRVPFG